MSQSKAATLLGHPEGEQLAAVALMREELRSNRWRLLAHNESEYGTQVLHYFAFANKNGSWVSGVGVSEYLALREVIHKISTYGLNEGPLPIMPYQVDVTGELSMILLFAKQQDVSDFHAWLQRIVK